MQLSGVSSSIHVTKGSSNTRSSQNCFYNESEDRFALASGNRDSVLGDIWAETLVDAFMHAGYPVENDSRIVSRVMEYARDLWSTRVNWDSLKWYVRNKAIHGARAYFTGIYLGNAREGPVISGFTSGYPGAYIMDSEGNVKELVKAGSHAGMDFWSGYSPESGVKKGVAPESDPYFKYHLRNGDTFTIMSYGVAGWMHNNGAMGVRSLLSSNDPAIFIKNLIRKRSIDDSDSVICIVKA